MQLRDYQQDVVNHITRNNNNVVYTLPTGTGKSLIINYIINQYVGQGKRIGIVVPSIELLRNIKHYILLKPRNKNLIQLMSDKEIDNDKFIYLGVWKSFEKKMSLLPKLDMVIHDECHHSASITWKNLLKLGRNIGFSATPFRFDGKPLPFDDIYEPYPISWFMEKGYLCSDIDEYIGEKLINDDTDFEDLEKQWQQAKNYIHGEFLKDWKNYNNGKTIVYATNIEHCYLLKEQYLTLTSCDVIHSKLSSTEREKVFERFEKGKIQVLINVNCIIEGVNIPDASTVQYARYFGSIGTYIQSIGRILRPMPNKKVIVIDNAGNLSHGSIKYFGEWKHLFYESFKYEEREEMINEFKRLSLPVPKFLTSKPIGSEKLVKYNLTKFQDALIKSLKKKSGEKMIDFWKQYMISSSVNSEEFTQILDVCSSVMSSEKAKRLLKEFI